MVEIEFQYNQQKLTIQGNLQDKFQDIVNKYYTKTAIPFGTFSFQANGKTMNLDETLQSQMEFLNFQDKKMTVLVDSADTEKKETVFGKSKEIICPKCNEPCKLKIENCKITLFDCVNNHTTDNIKIKDFSETQKINYSNIKCDGCKNTDKGKTYENTFYKCLTCSYKICPLCKDIPHKSHRVIDDKLINYICQKHNDSYIKFCPQCKVNICISCEKEHEGHDPLYFGDLMPNMEKVREQIID